MIYEYGKLDYIPLNIIVGGGTMSIGGKFPMQQKARSGINYMGPSARAGSTKYICGI